MVSTVNREKAPKLKGAENEISLTPFARFATSDRKMGPDHSFVLEAGETVVCPGFAHGFAHVPDLLKEEIIEDADWAGVIDELNGRLR